MNQCIFIGRLTKDVEIKETSSGKSVGKFTVAVPRKFKDANGERQADFIPCVAWGQKAGFIAHHFKKGDMIIITGELQSSSYEKDGQKIVRLDVNVADAEFCGSNNTGAKSKAPSEPLKVPEEVSEPLADEDLPFDL